MGPNHGKHPAKSRPMARPLTPVGGCLKTPFPRPTSHKKNPGDEGPLKPCPLL